ncbi:MAG: hypothetical protein ACKOWC_01430 [Limnohabitans sp.]
MRIKANPSKRPTGQRIMTRGYASILRAIQLRPSTAGEVAAALGFAGRTTTSLMWRMADLGLAHEVEWLSISGGAVARYAFGPGVRLHHPVMMARHVVTKNNLSPELVALAPLIHALLDEPRTVQELCDIGGHSRGTVFKFIRHCRAIKFVRIAEWNHATSGPPYPSFAIGSAADAKRPTPMGGAEACRRYMERKKRAVHFGQLAAAFSSAANQPEELAAA